MKTCCHCGAGSVVPTYVVEFLLGRTVRRFLVRGGRCAGVETDEGPVAAAQAVNAAGAWAGFDPDFPVPVEPVHGQIVEVESAAGDDQ